MLLSIIIGYVYTLVSQRKYIHILHKLLLLIMYRKQPNVNKYAKIIKRF